MRTLKPVPLAHGVPSLKPTSRMNWSPAPPMANWATTCGVSAGATSPAAVGSGAVGAADVGWAAAGSLATVAAASGAWSGGSGDVIGAEGVGADVVLAGDAT